MPFGWFSENGNPRNGEEGGGGGAHGNTEIKRKRKKAGNRHTGWEGVEMERRNGKNNTRMKDI